MAEEKRPVRRTGVVKRFLGGYGFIEVHGEEDRGRLFVHRSEVQSDDGRSCTLFQDDEVEFDIVPDGNDGSMKASHVTRPGGIAFDSSQRPRRVNSRPVRRSSGNGEVDRCDNCRGVGHWARVCPSPPQPRLEMQGRFAKDDGARGRRCYSCGEEGHFQRECQKGGGGGGGEDRRVCYNCQQTGHFARDCTTGERAAAASAAAGKKQETRKCYNCGKVGHVSNNCKEQQA